MPPASLGSCPAARSRPSRRLACHCTGGPQATFSPSASPARARRLATTRRPRVWARPSSGGEKPHPSLRLEGQCPATPCCQRCASGPACSLPGGGPCPRRASPAPARGRRPRSLLCGHTHRRRPHAGSGRRGRQASSLEEPLRGTARHGVSRRVTVSEGQTSPGRPVLFTAHQGCLSPQVHKRSSGARAPPSIPACRMLLAGDAAQRRLGRCRRRLPTPAAR